MSDVDDDYMCDDEEDYDLVSLMISKIYDSFANYLIFDIHLVISLCLAKTPVLEVV